MVLSIITTNHQEGQQVGGLGLALPRAAAERRRFLLQLGMAKNQGCRVQIEHALVRAVDTDLRTLRRLPEMDAGLDMAVFCREGVARRSHRSALDLSREETGPRELSGFVPGLQCREEQSKLHRLEGLFGQASGYQSAKSCAGLKGLFLKGMADRAFYASPRTEQQIALSLPSKRTELVYKLTRAGLNRGIKEGFFDADTPIIARCWKGDAPGDVEHRLLIVELMVKIRLEIAAQDRLAIARMFPDFVKVGKKAMTADDITKDRFIVPDLLAEIETFSGAKSTLFFAEIENSKLQPSSKNKKQKTIASKIKPYGRYLTSPHRKHKGSDQDVVLYVMNQPAEHLDAMIKLVPWDDVGAVAKLVRLTTFDDIRAHGVLDGRWRDCRGELVRITG